MEETAADEYRDVMAGLEAKPPPDPPPAPEPPRPVVYVPKRRDWWQVLRVVGPPAAYVLLGLAIVLHIWGLY